MKKILKLTESDLVNIVKKVLSEQKEVWNPLGLKFGDGGKYNPDKINDVKKLQKKLMDGGFLRTKSMKPTGYFGKLTNDALSRALKITKPKDIGPVKTPKDVTPNKTKKTISSGCQQITPNSDIKDLPQIVNLWQKTYPTVDVYPLINRALNRYSESYKSQGIPQRTACELGLIQIRPGYKDKNVFVIDTLNKLIYLYNNLGEFVAKSVIISGENKQSLNPKVIAQSLLTWDEQVNKLGFKWVPNEGYVDTTGKNRKYDNELVYSSIDKNKTRFLPKGIYTTSPSLSSNSEYAGKKENILSLYDGNKNIAQAIHGYYIEQPRIEALKKARQVLSNPNDAKVGEDFLNLVSGKGINLSQSYGCINVPENFLPYLRKYGTNSYVFNIGEDNENYLVNNTENYFDKMQNSQFCPSPQSLGAVSIDNIA